MNKLKLALAGLMIVPMLMLGAESAHAAPLAHPLGNFTINQYSALTVQGDGVVVHYVLDMAEIPTYQELGEIRADHSTALTQAEHDAYLQSKKTELLSNLQLLIDGKAVALQTRTEQLSFPAGAGNLPTLRVDMVLFAPVSGTTSGNLIYKDNNFSDRIGWKEIIITAGDGGTVSGSDVASTDRSNSLTNYPSDMLSTPPQIHQAQAAFSVNGVAPANSVGAAQPVVQASGDWIAGRMDALTQVMTQKELPFGALLVALAIAFVLGGAHALSPGHGKTVAAAYLVGSRGKPIHAVLLGLSVTITHTIGVFALGLITMFAAQYILPEQLFPWLSFASGLILVLMGLGLFTARLQALRERGLPLIPRIGPFARPEMALATATANGEMAHDDDGMHRHMPWGEPHSHVPPSMSSVQAHTESQPHAHGDGEGEHRHLPWGKPHSHVTGESNRASIGSIIALGASGGLLPCPSALIVMLSAISFNRIGLGIVLIIAFSFGLAAVLTGIGLLFLYARKFLDKAPINATLMLRLPVLSALGVAFLGVIIAVQALFPSGLFR